MATVISWKIKGLINADASKCYEEIGRDGASPQEVLDIARDPSTELHKCFEWNDGIAAEKYRLSQAQKVIQLLVVENRDENDKPVGRPKRVFQISAEKNQYKPIEFIMNHEDHYERLLERCKYEVRGIMDRYSEIADRDGEALWKEMRRFIED